MHPINDAHDLGGLNLTHFAMPIINTQKVVRFLIKKLRQLPYRLFPYGNMDAHINTKSKHADEFFEKMKSFEGVRLPGERRHKNRLDKGPRNINKDLVNKIKSLT